MLLLRTVLLIFYRLSTILYELNFIEVKRRHQIYVEENITLKIVAYILFPLFPKYAVRSWTYTFEHSSRNMVCPWKFEHDFELLWTGQFPMVLLFNYPLTLHMDKLTRGSISISTYRSPKLADEISVAVARLWVNFFSSIWTRVSTVTTIPVNSSQLFSIFCNY